MYLLGSVLYEIATGQSITSVTPLEIRRLVVDLVRQMCHPLPVRRERRFRTERNTPAWGLLWAIRRVDIIIKNLEHNRAVKAAANRRRHQ